MTGIDRQASFRHWTASQSGPQGQVAEWLKAADCKSARVSVRWFESSPVHHPPIRGCPPNPRSEEHTSELQSLMRISYAVFCLKKKTKILQSHIHIQRSTIHTQETKR